jgi:hypothetical protein
MWSRVEKIKHYLNNKNLLKCQRFEEDILLGRLRRLSLLKITKIVHLIFFDFTTETLF